MKLVALKYGESTLPCDQLYRGGDPTKSEPIAFVVYLLTLGKRQILIDAGCEDMPGFEMKHFCSPVAVLARYGLAPEAITDVVITHAHHDHIEAVGRFTEARVWIQVDELTKGKKYIPEGMPVRSFTRSARLADCARIRHVGGHTKGSSVVEITVGERCYVITGDACYAPRSLAECIPVGTSREPEKSLAFVRKYANAPFVPLLAHDPALLPGQNGFLTVLDTDGEENQA
jgi:glyoxylase-like metal-dependent hydrolase (beta-lactamase superfamily II)